MLDNLWNVSLSDSDFDHATLNDGDYNIKTK